MRRILTITLLGHLLNHSLTLIYPVIMIQLADQYAGVSLTILGLVGTIHYLLYGLGAFPAGWLTDRLGARGVLLIYFFGSFTAVILLVLATNLVQLAIGLALLGLFCALYHPSGLTLISHSSQRISRHLGIHGIAGSIGLTLGPLIGGVVAGWFGWRAPFLFFGFLALLAGLYWLLSSDEAGYQKSPSHSQAIHVNKIWPLILCYIVAISMGLAHRGTLNFLPLYFSESFRGILKPVMVGGFLTALVLASGILGQFFGGIWGERFPRSKILIIIVALNIPFLIMMSIIKGNTVILIAMLWGMINFSYQPISNALISDFSKPSQRGTFFGFLHGLNFGVGALAATLGGAIGDRWGTASIFTAMGILLIPAIIASYLLRRNENSLSIDSE